MWLKIITDLEDKIIFLKDVNGQIKIARISFFIQNFNSNFIVYQTKWNRYRLRHDRSGE